MGTQPPARVAPPVRGKLVNTDWVAERLGWSTRTVRNRCKENPPPFPFMRDIEYRFDTADIEEYAASIYHPVETKGRARSAAGK